MKNITRIVFSPFVYILFLFESLIFTLVPPFTIIWLYSLYLAVYYPFFLILKWTEVDVQYPNALESYFENKCLNHLAHVFFPIWRPFVETYQFVKNGDLNFLK